jgi:hypothetical protein
MAVKDLTILSLQPIATIATGSYDFVGFTVGWVYALTDATDNRVGWSWGNSTIQKVIICPAGIAYPGDAALGGGGKQIIFTFTGSLPTVTMNNCENLDTSFGWAVITKGDFTIAYSPSILKTVTILPS